MPYLWYELPTTGTWEIHDNRNNMQLCADSIEVSTLMHVTSNEGGPLIAELQSQGYSVHQGVSHGGKFAHVSAKINSPPKQHDMVHVTEKWLVKDFHCHTSMQRPSSCDYYAWGVIKRETNHEPHNTKDSLKITIQSRSYF